MVYTQRRAHPEKWRRRSDTSFSGGDEQRESPVAENRFRANDACQFTGLGVGDSLNSRASTAAPYNGE